MSYTPEDQKIDEPIEKLVDAIRDAKAPMLERIRHRKDWGSDHYEELKVMVRKLQDLEFELLEMKG